ncbi:MAG: MFS transporter [Chthonomonadales bacterium]|nr:MFS transporter [Chthonomonadales bacterium]
MRDGSDAPRRGPGRPLAARFPALAHRGFRLLWIGQCISVAGSQMQSAAILWHVALITHSPRALGMIGLFSLIAIVIFSPLGGAVADSRDRRQVLLVTSVLLAAAAALLAWMTLTGRVSLAAIYAITALSAAVVAFANPARHALLPNLVPREDFSSAVSLTSIASQVASIVGPTLAGALIGVGWLGYTYLANAVSFLAVVVALLMIPAMGPASGGEGGAISLAALRDGFRFVWRAPILVWTIVLDFLATFFSSATCLLPLFATDVLRVGAHGYGLLAAASGIGSLVAGSAMAVQRRVQRQGLLILTAVGAYGFTTVLFGISRWFWLSWLALALIGASDTVSTILRQTIRQMVTPDALRGRMTSVNMLFFKGGPQLGELEAGLVAQAIGAPAAVVVGGVGCLLAVAWVAARAPQLRHYRHEGAL